MSDSIDREAAIGVLETGAEFLRLALDDIDVVWSDQEKFAWGLEIIETFIADIKELPTAQPEITRCAECIHWKHSAIRKSYCEVFDWTNKAVDFCSFAERKDDEE